MGRDGAARPNDERVLVRAKPYNAAAKPIEGAFSAKEKVLSMLPGYVGGDRMNKRVSKVGRAPDTYPGSAEAFDRDFADAMAFFHATPQRGHLKGLSPAEAFRLAAPKVQATRAELVVFILAFSEEKSLKVRTSGVQIGSKDGGTWYFGDELVPLIGSKCLFRIAKWHPQSILLVQGTGAQMRYVAIHVFAFWGMITFILTFLIVFIPSMFCWLIPDPKGQQLFIGIARLWMNIWLPLAGCRFPIKGKEHFRKGQTYIVTCNHNSLMDVPLSSAFIPGGNKTIAKSSFTKVPLFGLYYMKGAVIVNRKSELSRRQSFDKMKKVLKKGIHMCIYPEGTRNRTAEPLKKFHDGAFRLSAETGVSIIPAIILNTKKVLPLNKVFYMWPGKWRAARPVRCAT